MKTTATSSTAWREIIVSGLCHRPILLGLRRGLEQGVPVAHWGGTATFVVRDRNWRLYLPMLGSGSKLSMAVGAVGTELKWYWATPATRRGLCGGPEPQHSCCMHDGPRVPQVADQTGLHVRESQGRKRPPHRHARRAPLPTADAQQQEGIGYWSDQQDQKRPGARLIVFAKVIHVHGNPNAR